MEARKLNVGEEGYHYLMRGVRIGQRSKFAVKSDWVVYVDDENCIHNDNGPAFIATDEFDDLFIIYYKHGRYHNATGPAIVRKSKDGIEVGIYYINGTQYTKEEFDEFIKGLNNDEKELASDLGQTFD